MINKNKSVMLFMLCLLFVFVQSVYAQGQVGEPIAFEGYVENIGQNALFVDGKILVPDQYSAINTNGENIYIGDYVLGYIYLNPDGQSYTIVSLVKDAMRALGTPTPTPTSTATPVWADLFTPTPAPSGSASSSGGSGLNLVTLGDLTGQNSDLSESEEELKALYGDNWILFAQPTATPTIMPTSTPSTISFEGVVTDIQGIKIFVDDVEYVTDNSTNYKDNKKDIKIGDYVSGRAAPFATARVVLHIEVIPEFERPDAEKSTEYGLVAGQDKEKITITTKDGDKNFYFYSSTKMTKSFYTKGSMVGVSAINNYAASVTEYPMVVSNEELSPINGKISQIVKLGDNEVYFISSNETYFVRTDVVYKPNSDGFVENAPFVGLMKNGQVVMLVFTESNHIKTISGSVTSVDKSDPLKIRFMVGGVEYVLGNDAMFFGGNISRNTEVIGYADANNNVFYLSAKSAWYASLKDWNWSIIAPAAVIVIGLLLFLILHRTKVTGYLSEVNGNILTITDSKGENARHYTCVDEIARYAGSLITMKVEVVVYNGKVIHITYDF